MTAEALSDITVVLLRLCDISFLLHLLFCLHFLDWNQVID